MMDAHAAATKTGSVGSFREFVAAKRSAVTAELQGDGSDGVPKTAAVMKELATRWKAMSPQEKARFPPAEWASASSTPGLDGESSPSERGHGSASCDEAAASVTVPWHPPLDALRNALLGEASVTAPVALKMRAIYYLRTIGTREAMEILCSALDRNAVPNGGHSPLMRHELAYVLGQLQDPAACAALEATLSDVTDDVMVRHECAEALGAIGSARSLPLLERMSLPDAEPGHPVEIEQTCRVATDFCRWKASGGATRGEAAPGVACACMLSPYTSHDPAPPDPATDGMTTAEVGAVLRDESRPLFERYGAMFALRNRGGANAVHELGSALVTDASSALLRHEVAFVLGQMQHPAALDALAEALARPAEHSMVRHEAAEALGALEFDDDDENTSSTICGCGDGGGYGCATGACSCGRDGVGCASVTGAERRRLILLHHSNDEFEPDSVVRESCEVALDATDYWANLNADGDTDSKEQYHEQIGYHALSAASGAVGFKALKTSLEVRRAHFNIK